MPPESSVIARPLEPTGMPPAPGVGRGMDVGCVVAHFEVGRPAPGGARRPSCPGRRRPAETADVLGELNARHVEALVRAARLNLEAIRVLHVLFEVLARLLEYGVLVPFRRRRRGVSRDYAEHMAHGLEGRVHVRALVLGLDVDGGLHAVDTEIPRAASDASVYWRAASAQSSACSAP